MIYLFFVLLLLYLSYRFDGRKDNTDLIYAVVWLLLVCMMGISRELGGDKITYIEFYEDCPTLAEGVGYVKDFTLFNLLKGYMPFWTWGNVLIKTIFPHTYVPFQFIHAAFVNGIFFWFFKRNSPYKYLCVLLYFVFRGFHFNCETMRESIALAIFLIALPAFNEKNWKRYYSLALLALCFHVSSTIIFILPFVPTLNFNIKRFCIAGVASTLCYFMIGFVLLRLLDYLTVLGLGDRYSEYLGSTGNFNGFIGNFIAFMGIPWLVYYQMKNWGEDLKEWEQRMMEKYLLIAPFILSFITLNRFFEYFAILSIYIYARYLWKYTLMKRAAATAIVVLLLIFRNTVQFYCQKYDGGFHRWDLYLPYTTAFDDTPTSYRKTLHDITLIRGQRMEREEK